MKVMIYRYNSICEPDVIEAFKELGIEVVEETTEMTKKNMTPSEAVRKINEFLQKNPVDFAFSINFFPYLAEVCNIFKIPYLSWIVDSPVMELYTTSVTKEYNRIFLFDRALYNEIYPLNPGRVFHFPLASNVNEKTELFKKTSQKIKDKFSHEVAFVGSLYTEKCPYDKVKNLPKELEGYLDGIMRAQQKVYGYYFIEELLDDKRVEEFVKCMPNFYRLPEGSFLNDKRTMSQLYIGSKISSMERIDTFDILSQKFNVSIYTGSDTSSMPKLHNMGFAKSRTEMPIIFNQSKINLNITSKSIRSGLPLRVFDILSSGGFMLSNYQEELYEFFDVGNELAVYTDINELIQLVEYYLNHEKERIEIAQAGLERVKKEYTYIMQLEKLIRIAFGEN